MSDKRGEAIVANQLMQHSLISFAKRVGNIHQPYLFACGWIWSLSNAGVLTPAVYYQQKDVERVFEIRQIRNGFTTWP